MPEGPECHYAAKRLEIACQGKYITSFDIHGGRYEKHGPFEGYDKLSKHINDKESKVKAVGCRGKLIVMFFENNWCLLCTLGLKGSWTSKKVKHCDVSFELETGNRLWFKDQIHYGTLKYVHLNEAVEKMISLGPDVTVDDPAFTYQYLTQLINKYPKWDTAKLLMDQSKISGIGNYLKAEILYDSKIAPHRLCSTLKDEEILAMYTSIINIPSAFYQSYIGGPNIRLHVYNRKKDRLGYNVEKCKTKDGRTSHWVPDVQTFL